MESKTCLFCGGEGCEFCTKPAPGPFEITKTMPAAQANNIKLGLHPMGRPLLEEGGHTCGDCAHFVRYAHRSRSYFKCDLSKVTHGPGTDIRMGWLACNRFENKG